MGSPRGRCHYCGVAAGDTRDHIVPRHKGGMDAPWNIVQACQPCNLAKGHRWPTCPCEICEYARERHVAPLDVLQREVRPTGNASEYFKKLMQDRGWTDESAPGETATGGVA